MARILWFHPRALLPAHGGGEIRTLGLIDAAVAAGHEVLVIQPGPLGTEETSDFRLLGLDLRRGANRALAKVASPNPLRSARPTSAAMKNAAAEIAAFKPDATVVADVMSWSFASRLLPGTAWIYDAHNVEAELFRGFRDNAKGVADRLTFTIDHRRVQATERRMLATASAVTTVSADDARTFQLLAPANRVVVVPSSVPLPVNPVDPGAADPTTLFVGTLDYPPNVAALEALIGTVMPAVRERVPGAELLVAGRRPTDGLRKLMAANDWIDFWENAPDIGTAYREARCAVLPMTFGGGSRLKVYEALAHGLPVIGTHAAFDGMDLGGDPTVHGYLMEELVGTTVHVLRDAAEARRLGSAGRSLFTSSMSWDMAARPMLALIDEFASS